MSIKEKEFNNVPDSSHCYWERVLQQYIASLPLSHINKMIVLSITKNTLIFNILVQTYKHCTRREQLA